MPARTRDDGAASFLQDLHANVSRIFDQAQVTTANHQKNFVALHKLQSEAARHTEALGNDRVKLTGERAFEKVFTRMICQILPLKKGATPADRVVKFVGGFVQFIQDKAPEDHDEDDDDDETPASRLTLKFFTLLLRGFVAKDKAVRYRVIQLTAEMISRLGELDTDIYAELRSSLLDRLNDKESSVRVQAAIALSKLASTEQVDDLRDDEQLLEDTLAESLAYDPSADVRRAILVNIPLTHNTLPAILDRTRDVDATIRKFVYTEILEKKVFAEENCIGISHPRALTIAQRELIVQNGLGDRDHGVRKAAAAVLGLWVDIATENVAKNEEQEGTKAEPNLVMPKLMALLEMFDLETETIAADALVSVFETQPQIYENVEFGDEYWASLTPESAFLARVFVEHCTAKKDEARLERHLPVVTMLVFKIQESYHALNVDLQDRDAWTLLEDDERHQLEDALREKLFILTEMIKLSVNLDYSDETGRRKMLQFIREMISSPSLPEPLMLKCMDVLRTVSYSEKDLIRIVVELVNDLRDSGNEDDGGEEPGDPDASFDSEATPVKRSPAKVSARQREEMSPQEKADADRTDLKCLAICTAMLERVNGKFDDNSTLQGLLKALIGPSVQRHELEFRTKGLVCFGLIGLISKKYGIQLMPLILTQIRSLQEGDEKNSLFLAFFDLLMVHERDLFSAEGTNADTIPNFLNEKLEEAVSDKTQAILAIGIAKLVFANIIEPAKALPNLILAYLKPSTAENQELRQGLSYFFHKYSTASRKYQRSLQMIFIETLHNLLEMRRNLDEDEEMISTTQFGLMFVDWTSPLQTSGSDVKGTPLTEDDESIHVDMAMEILKELFNKKEMLEKEDKKALCQLLGKLHLPEKVDDVKIKRLKMLMQDLRARRPLRDTVTNNAFTKFETTVSNKYAKQLEDFSEEDFRKMQEWDDLFEFLDDMIPENEDEVFDAPKKKGRKRRSESIISTTTDIESVATSTDTRRGNGKAKSKRRRLSNSDDESDFDDDQATPPPPTRRLPKRAAATRPKPPPQVIEISSDSDEEATPGPPRRRPQASSSGVRRAKIEEAEIDANIDDLLDDATDEPNDSIMDANSDDEEEEDEVNDLLAEE